MGRTGGWQYLRDVGARMYGQRRRIRSIPSPGATGNGAHAPNGRRWSEFRARATNLRRPQDDVGVSLEDTGRNTLMLLASHHAHLKVMVGRRTLATGGQD